MATFYGIRDKMSTEKAEGKKLSKDSIVASIWRARLRPENPAYRRTRHKVF